MKRRRPAEASERGEQERPSRRVTGRERPAEDVRRYESSELVVMTRVLDEESVRRLRLEADAIFRAKCATDRDLAESGCALDATDDTVLTPWHAGRTDPSEYLQLRFREEGPLGPFRSDAVHQTALKELLFQKLASVAKALLGTPEVFLFNEHFVVS